MSCKYSLLNNTATTTFTPFYNETFIAVQGFNQVYLGQKVLFDTKLNNIYFTSNESTQLTFYETGDLTNSLYDLKWNGTSLTRIVNESSWKFNFKILTQKYIFQDTVSLGSIYYLSQVYNVTFNFGVFSTSVIEKPYIWPGKL